MLTSRSADITKSFCAPTFEPDTVRSRPAINTTVSPVKVVARDCSQSRAVLVCVVFDDINPLVL
ncbi:hypothetical protein D3C87_1315390 [compost metagenome]